MESSNTILKELQELSPTLASSYPVSFPFKVPEGYFDQLPSRLQHVLSAENIGAIEEIKELSPLLSSISKKSPFQTPENYFSDLSENSLAATKAIAFVQEELDEFSPVLHNLKQAAAYQVPAGYFDQLPVAILQKVQPSEAKVIKMRGAGIRRYITAAAAVLVLAVGAWWYFQPAGFTPATASTGIENVSDEELIRFIDDQTLASGDLASLSGIEADNNSMQDLLADVSDEELQQYIDKNSSLIKTISN